MEQKQDIAEVVVKVIFTLFFIFMLGMATVMCPGAIVGQVRMDKAKSDFHQGLGAWGRQQIERENERIIRPEN